MICILKVIGAMSCGVVLFLGLPNSAQAINNVAEELKELKSEQHADGQAGRAKKEEEAAKGIQTIYGEVLQVKHNQYVVKKYDGNVVRLDTDNNTQLSGSLTQGDRIVAKVVYQKHALLIQPIPLIQ
jgi:hypothetical protein